MDYHISSRSYLERAKTLLLHQDKPSLFYAAYELRCCIEARLSEYILAQREYLNSVPKGWKIDKQQSVLSKLMSSDKIQKISLQFEDGEKVELYHVPVNDWLRKKTEQLGELLHSQQKFRPPDDVWWTISRDRLKEIYEAAWNCCQSTLVSPVLVDKNMSVGTMKIQLIGNLRTVINNIQRIESVFEMEATYLEKAPEEWISDLNR